MNRYSEDVVLLNLQKYKGFNQIFVMKSLFDNSCQFFELQDAMLGAGVRVFHPSSAKRSAIDPFHLSKVEVRGRR